MPHPVHVNSERDGALLNRMMRDYDQGHGIPPTELPTGERRHESRSTICFVLLDELESGGEAQALVLRKSTRKVQIVTLKGTISGGSFQLHYHTPIVSGGPDASGEISYNATANEMKAALEQMESIGQGGVRVTLGKVAYLDSAGDEVEVVTGRWFIEFLNLASPQLLQPFETASIQLTGSPNAITAETHFLSVTKQRETVLSVTPVGNPTPQHVGAIGTAQWIHGIGWAVDSIECRDFELDITDPYGS